MATLSELVFAVANVTGLPAATVFAYGRFAREAGYISQGGRGRGGAKMKATDAANLLIAITGTRITREAGAAIEVFRALPGSFEGHWEPQEPVKRWVEDFIAQELPGKFYFGQFMDFLLTQAMTSSLEALMRSMPVYDVPQFPNPEYYEAVEKFEKDNSSIRLKHPDSIDLIEDLDLRLTFSSPNVVFVSVGTANAIGFGLSNFLRLQFGSHHDPHHSDLDTSVSISQRTILAVGRCLAGPEMSEAQK